MISKSALISYLAKYISKSEVPSQALDALFKGVIDKLDEDMNAKRAINRVLMKSCAERDIPAQEVCHTLLGLKLHCAGGRQFVCLNMSDKKWMELHAENADEDDGFSKRGKSVIEKYKGRPKRLQNTSLWDSAKMYNPSTWRPTEKANIVRVFPKLTKRESDESHEPYYKQQVLLHIPWRNEEDIKNVNDTWEDIYVRNNLQDKVNGTCKLDQNDNETNEEDEFETDDTANDNNEDEIIAELLSSRLGPKTDIPTINLGNREVDVNYNWHEAYKNYEQYGTLPEF